MIKNILELYYASNSSFIIAGSHQRILRYFLYFVFLYTIPAHAWDTPSETVSQQTHWIIGGSYYNNGPNFSFIDDGTSELRLSTTPPTPGSTGGFIMKNNTATTYEGINWFRAFITNKDANGRREVFVQTSVSGINNRNGFHSGTFYVWYGTQKMITVNWSWYYEPTPFITVPTGVIDFGVCHRSQKNVILKKPVNISILVVGYTGGKVYPITRFIKYSGSTDGFSLSDGKGTEILQGEKKTMLPETPELPLTFQDTIEATLRCDEASIGIQNWSVNLTYTVG